MNDEWYQSSKWRRIRQSVLRRDAYMDQWSKRFGIVLPAEIVHHIFPKDEYPEYAYEPWNLISLSRKTHNEMHDRDTDELTEKGRELLRKICLRKGIPIPEKYKTKKAKGMAKQRDKYYY